MYIYIYIFPHHGWFWTIYLRRETQKVDQSERRQREDTKEGAAHIVALLAWCGCWFILWVTESTLFTRLLDSWLIAWVLSLLFIPNSLFDCLLGWLSAHIQAVGLWSFLFYMSLHQRGGNTFRQLKCHPKQ